MKTNIHPIFEIVRVLEDNPNEPLAEKNIKLALDFNIYKSWIDGLNREGFLEILDNQSTYGLNPGDAIYTNGGHS